jgi:hypothetical protein
VTGGSTPWNPAFLTNCPTTPWRQFDTLRNRLIKLVAEVTETADRIQIALALVFPVEDILTVVSSRLARFVT